MTFSIVARDPATGAFGIACETHFFGVGRLVGWLEPGVGVIATQAFVNVGFGPRGIDLLRDGSTAPEAQSRLIEGDDQPEYRQLAIIDGDGRVANFTGDKCVQAAGALSGDQVSVQGNMLASDRFTSRCFVPTTRRPGNRSPDACSPRCARGRMQVGTRAGRSPRC